MKMIHHYDYFERLSNLQIPNKVKNFVWRACSDSLPTKTQMLKRKVIATGRCPLGNEVGEDLFYILFKCLAVQQFGRNSMKIMFGWSTSLGENR